LLELVTIKIPIRYVADTKIGNKIRYLMYLRYFII
jgi:hypothetical protein